MGMRHTFQSNRILIKEDFDKVDKERGLLDTQSLICLTKKVKL
jgi:hypothetical protein